MEKTVYSALGESVWHGRLPNGLHIYVDEKPEYREAVTPFLPPATAAWTCGSARRTAIGGTPPPGSPTSWSTSCSTPRTATPSRILAANGA